MLYTYTNINFTWYIIGYIPSITLCIIHNVYKYDIEYASMHYI